MLLALQCCLGFHDCARALRSSPVFQACALALHYCPVSRACALALHYCLVSRTCPLALRCQPLPRLSHTQPRIDQLWLPCSSYRCSPVCTCGVSVYAHTHVYMYMYRYITCTYICMCVLAYMYTYIHTYRVVRARMCGGNQSSLTAKLYVVVAHGWIHIHFSTHKHAATHYYTTHTNFKAFLHPDGLVVCGRVFCAASIIHCPIFDVSP